MNYQHPRCQVIPLPDHQATFVLDGQEKLRWHFGPSYPRPFFYPLVGPSGHSVTRMGHPGAPNHDHHRSVWFAHHKVLGIDFWSDQTEARIKQHSWLCYQDGMDEAIMAVQLRWYDGHDPKELIEQELIVAVRPAEQGETLIEIQSTFHPRADSFEFGQTNFGFLAVRVAKNISAHFGGGELTNSEGLRSEAEIFGKPASWMDYSGPAPASGEKDAPAMEGITYFDHPSNINSPAHWHVREDGWMGAAPCMNSPVLTTREQPLVLRYLLHVHAGDIQPDRAKQLATEFAARPAMLVEKSGQKHLEYIVRRAST